MMPLLWQVCSISVRCTRASSCARPLRAISSSASCCRVMATPLTTATTELEAALAHGPRATPLQAIGPLIQDQVILSGKSFAMWRPAEPDRLLEHPATLEAFAHDEYMPYWCDLWPASRMLAKAILAAP